MPLRERHWKVLWVDDIPEQIKDHQRYADGDHWFESALIRDDNRGVILRFENGKHDLWEIQEGCWLLVNQRVDESTTLPGEDSVEDAYQQSKLKRYRQAYGGEQSDAYYDPESSEARAARTAYVNRQRALHGEPPIDRPSLWESFKRLLWLGDQ